MPTPPKPPTTIATLGASATQPAEEPGVTQRAIWPFPPQSDSAPAAPRTDSIAIEEPLELRVNGETVAITMRTPGADPQLALGFLFAEGILDSMRDVAALSDPAQIPIFAGENIVDVHLHPANAARLGRAADARRGTLTTSACGVCGRKTVGDLIDRCGTLAGTATLHPATITQCVARLGGMQTNFARTGGVHAAAIFSAAGELLTVHEDVGRHNATDKAIGELLQTGQLPAAQSAAAPALLVVSGRASFELVQKAGVARLPFLASVSAPSSLAIDLAESCGLTLIGFVRGGRFNIYTHPARIA